MACAKAMGAVKFEPAISGSKRYDWQHENGGWTCNYDPLHDDAQCFALVKKFQLDLGWYTDGTAGVNFFSHESHPWLRGTDLNRLVCECVAQIK